MIKYSCWSLLVVLLFISNGDLNAQNVTGIKISGHFTNDLALTNTYNFGDSLVLTGINPNREYSVGVWTRWTADQFLLQAELLLTNTQEKYDLGFPMSNNAIRTIADERFFVELPILIGWNINPVNIYGGAAPRFATNQPTNLANWFSYGRVQTDFTLKYIVGVGLNLGSLKLDFRYNNRILEYEDVVFINEQSFKTVDHLERFTVSMLIDLFRQ